MAEMGQGCAAVIAQQQPLRVLAASLALRRGDIPLSAIDFHCSNVIETLLGRRELGRAVLAAYKASLPPRDWEAADTHDSIESAAKTAMWVCSSSTNMKQIVEASGEGRYYGGDPVVPTGQARVWAVLEEAAVAVQAGVVAGRVPAAREGGPSASG